jgi:hypothetical protein
VLYDLSPDQCERSADCASFGVGYSCEAGLCKAPAQSQGGSGGAIANTGGKGSSGGASGGSVSSEGGAGSSAGGAGGEGGSPEPECSDTAACDAIYGVEDPHTCEEGVCRPVPAECATHAECFTKYGETQPLACVKGRCAPLLTDECPVVLPRLTGADDIYSLLKRSNAVITGAFTFVSPSSLDGITVRNYDMVLKDFFTKSNGIVLGGQRRDVAMVVCYSNQTDNEALMTAGRHLAYDLDVPAILAALPADDTQRLFETFRSERGKNVFFLMPNYTDETLINLEDDSLIWHMLSGADALAVSHRPLLEMVETHLRNAKVVAPSEDMRVSLITATDERFSNDLGTAIRTRIRFNGDKTAAQNSPASFSEEGTTSYTSDVNHSFDHAPEVDRILAFAPHVIISANGEEMLDKILPLVESKWASTVGTQPKPFYVFSPFQYNSSYLSQLDGFPSVRSRMAGLNWPAAADRTLYQAYVDRYQLLFGRRDEGYENFYDAAYYLVYAIAGGRSPEATAIAAGFKRLLAGTAYEVGQADMISILNALAKPTGDVRLVGTMGPPNWDVITGGRTDAGSVWCVDGTAAQRSDVLRYEMPSGSAGGVLSGTFPCFPFPKPP